MKIALRGGPMDGAEWEWEFAPSMIVECCTVSQGDWPFGGEYWPMELIQDAERAEYVWRPKEKIADGHRTG